VGDGVLVSIEQAEFEVAKENEIVDTINRDLNNSME